MTPIDNDRTYQIFKREAHNTTVCIEVVKGFDGARNRIEQARTASPGSELFIFDPLTGKVVQPCGPKATTDPLTPRKRCGSPEE
jgi:hypothetical protein